MTVLSDAKIRAIKPKNKPYKRSDFDGLYLLVNPSGSKLWRFKYRFGGKEKLLALGKYPDVTLAVARRLRDEARVPYIAIRSLAKMKPESVAPCLPKDPKPSDSAFEIAPRAGIGLRYSYFAAAAPRSAFACVGLRPSDCV